MAVRGWSLVALVRSSFGSCCWLLLIPLLRWCGVGEVACSAACSSPIIATSLSLWLAGLISSSGFFGAMIRLQAPSMALVLSLPEGCPSSDPLLLYGVRLDGCIRSWWNAMEAVFFGTNHRTTASSDFGFSSYRRWSLLPGLLWGSSLDSLL